MVLIRFIGITSLHVREEHSMGVFSLEEVGLGSNMCIAIRLITILGGRTQQLIRLTGVRERSGMVC